MIVFVKSVSWILDISYKRILTIDFDTAEGWVRGLHGVNFKVAKGENLGMVGESGSGKSMTCMVVTQLLGPRALLQGEIRYRNRSLLDLEPKEFNQIRSNEIAMIFQEAMSSLNPNQTIGRQIVESVNLNPRRSVGVSGQAKLPPKMAYENAIQNETIFCV